MTTRARLLGAVAVAAVLVAGWLFLRAGDDGPDPEASRQPAATPAATTGTAAAEAISRQYLTPAAGQPVATVQGQVEVSNTQKTPATLDVLALETNDRSTVLRWRLSTPAMTNLNTPQFARGRATNATSALQLTSRQTNQRLLPGTFVQESLSACSCSDLPYRSGPDGVELSAVLAPLEQGATEVELAVPGFPVVKVPVTRR
jgi:hypothetical protein